MLKTRLTEMFGLRYPIVLAPLGGGSTSGPLAAAVSKAGGLGMFGGIHRAGPEWVREQIRYVREQTDAPFGVGFITWALPDLPDNFQVCIDERVPVLAFSFGDPTAYVARAKEAGARVLCQVQTLEGARTALAAGADVIVAQGNEAGGHTGGQLSTLSCLALVLELAGDTPVLVAGGICGGHALAAVLAGGAEGAWIGTPLLATDEATGIADVYKDCIVQSDGQDTIFTRVYDIVYGGAWPEGVAERVRANRFTAEWHGREQELQERRQELLPTLPAGMEDRRDPERHPILIGQSAGSVTSIRPAAEVVRGLCDDAERILRERIGALLA